MASNSTINAGPNPIDQQPVDEQAPFVLHNGPRLVPVQLDAVSDGSDEVEVVHVDPRHPFNSRQRKLTTKRLLLLTLPRVRVC